MHLQYATQPEDRQTRGDYCVKYVCTGCSSWSLGTLVLSVPVVSTWQTWDFPTVSEQADWRLDYCVYKSHHLW